ncbi:hypothetical protein WJX77_008717 [Trebouxia sp. C0004]
MAANGRVSGTGTPEVDKEYVAAVEGAKKEVETLLEQTRCVPLFLRLAYHDAMTYDGTTKTGGANGSIRVQRELDHAGNESLGSAIDLLEPIKAQYQVLTYADLFQLSGIVAVRVAGGPFINFTPGRRDSRVAPPQGRLPSFDLGSPNAVTQLKKVFERLGLSTQQFVVLLGAHYIGRWGRETTTDPDLFDKHYRDLSKRFSNAYFKDLLKGTIPQDGLLLEDAEIKAYVEQYAADQGTYLKDYAAAHEALTKLGTELPVTLYGSSAVASSSIGSLATSYTTQEVVLGAAVIIGSGILAAGWWWNRRKRLLRGRV